MGDSTLRPLRARRDTMKLEIRVSKGLLLWLVCGLALGGCTSAPTSVKLSMHATGVASVDSLVVDVALPAEQRTAERALGSRSAPLTWPQTLLLELSDRAMELTITATAMATDGATMTATGSVTSVPHRQVSLDLDLTGGADGGDGGVGSDGGGDGGDGGGVVPVWEPVAASSPGQRHSARMVYDSARNQMLLFGGIGPNGLLHDTQLWDGTQWRMATPATSPPARRGFGLAYDSARQVVVLFGGADSSNSSRNDTWEWDGSNWMQRVANGASQSLPLQVQTTVMAYHGARQRSVVFGGWAGYVSQQLGDTWEWDGISWTKQVTSPTPPPDHAGALAYDSARMVIVYVPGPATGGPTIDTWEYDVGGRWTKRTIAGGPPMRRSAGLAYDEARGVTVLFGGQDHNGNDLGDTWWWDGTGWTQWMGSGPPGRRSTAVAFDPAQRRLWLFGGASGFHNGRNTGPAMTWNDLWRF